MTKILVYVVKSRGESYPKDNHGFRTGHDNHDPFQYENIAKDAARQEYKRNKGSFDNGPLEIEIYSSSDILTGISIGRFIIEVVRLPDFWAKIIKEKA